MENGLPGASEWSLCSLLCLLISQLWFRTFVFSFICKYGSSGYLPWTQLCMPYFINRAKMQWACTLALEELTVLSWSLILTISSSIRWKSACLSILTDTRKDCELGACKPRQCLTTLLDRCPSSTCQQMGIRRSLILIHRGLLLAASLYSRKARGFFWEF